MAAIKPSYFAKEVLDVELELQEFTLVVLASDHNPSLLNPDFLRIQDIVPKDWKVTEPVVVTPSVATVRYDEGVSITVARARLHISDHESPDPSRSKIVDIAGAYIKTLPHIRYTALEANFSARVATEDPLGLLRSRFLTTRSLDLGGHSLEDAGVRLAFSIASSDVQLAFDTELPDGTDHIVVVGSFHCKWDAYPAVDEATEALQTVVRDWGIFKDIVTNAISSGPEDGD
jgi:hypothetical protein